MKFHVCLTTIAIAVSAAAAPVFGIPAEASPQQSKCQAAKTKAGGDYLDCRQTAEAKFVKTGDAAKRATALAKCTDKLLAAFTKAEAAAEGACPTTGDVDAVEGLATQCSSALASSVETGGAIPGCGDGVVNSPGEHCDGSDLGGATCASLAYDIGDLGCSGACRFEAGRCSRCDSGLVGCDGACVDTMSDNENCGACGVTCEGTESCVDGSCVTSGGGCNGFEYGGACWYLTADEQNCSNRCAAEGKVVDRATATVAGHLGTNAACEAVLTGLGYPGAVFDSNTVGESPCYTQYDCHVIFSSSRVRCTSEVENDYGAPGRSRACACAAAD